MIWKCLTESIKFHWKLATALTEQIYLCRTLSDFWNIFCSEKNLTHHLTLNHGNWLQEDYRKSSNWLPENSQIVFQQTSTEVNLKHHHPCLDAWRYQLAFIYHLGLTWSYMPNRQKCKIFLLCTLKHLKEEKVCLFQTLTGLQAHEVTTFTKPIASDGSTVQMWHNM